MSETLFRSIAPLWLSGCGVLIFAIAVFGKVDAASFSIAANLAATAIGAAGGAATQSAGKRVTAENVENIDMDSTRH